MREKAMLDNVTTSATALDLQLAGLSLVERLKALRASVTGRIVFTTSLGLEDQVITHVIASEKFDIEIVTLDTGRLFPETYTLWDTTERRYGITIKGISPQAADVESYVAANGINGFLDSIEARKACCDIRKVRGLRRALAGAALWITGLRADQSANRGDTRFVTEDAGFSVLKASPLLDWTRDQAVQFTRDQFVPVNPLHDQGFLSIGCAPCTRAVEPGQSERSGRWWWEDEDKKECGLHQRREGQERREGTDYRRVAA
jgi:phosphoadenosine phosphosulfate reductase